MKRALAALAGLLLAGAVVVTVAPSGSSDAATTTGAATCVISGDGPASDAIDRNGRTVIAVGRAARVPDRGIREALATILVESGGLNLASRRVPESIRYPNDGVVAGDHLSINLFQQQVGMGWFPTVQEGMKVDVAAASFYRVLATVPNWQLLPFGTPAQAVQRSAFPARYAAREADATALLARLSSAPTDTTGVCTDQPAGPVALSGRWANPLRPAAYVMSSPFGWRTLRGVPNLHKGQDLAVPTGTPVRAVCDSRVAAAGWDPYGGGNMTTLDCGGGITVKLMHQSAIAVRVGQTVRAGETIGASGTTGNSTGPHLHEQVEVDGVPTDPVPFMRDRGVPL